MFKNFFTTAYRNLAKNKLFTVLNVFGMALGMSLCLLYITWGLFVFTYDDFHTNKERIYRVNTLLRDNKDNPEYACAPMGLVQKLKKEITGVEKVVRISASLSGDAIYQDKKIQLHGYFAEPEFFQVFNFPMIEGDINSALANPGTIVLSKTEAEKIFGNKEAMGQMIRIEPYGDLLVTGIFEDVPANSHMQFSAVASHTTIFAQDEVPPLAAQTNWEYLADSYVYFLLSKNASSANIESALNKIAKKDYAKTNFDASFKLQRLDKIIPGSQVRNSIGPSWDWLSFFLIGAITLVILIPACSNYVNLSISQSLERMREIGVRKVMGGQKKHIFLMFIIEAVVVSGLALVLSFVMSEIIRKDFLFQMVDVPPLNLEPTVLTFVGFILFAILVGVAAGIVPAFYFLKVSAIDALKGKELKSSGRSYFRKVIITTQFMLSLGFTMAVMIMIRQYQFSINYDFGFEQANVLDVELQNVDPEIFKHEYGKLPFVKRISHSSHVVGIGNAPLNYLRFPQTADSIEASSISVDEAFIPNMELSLIAGKNFTGNTMENSRSIIVNEEFVKNLHLKNPDSALGRAFILHDGKEVRIAGVMKNFQYSGLKSVIKSFYFEYDPSRFAIANVKLQTADLAADLTSMQKLWKKIGGEGEFTSQLFSDEIKDAFSYYVTISTLWGFLGLLAITVACLGLLGSVSFTTKKRFKEVSIRKVLGASAQSLVMLLSKEFIMLMIIACVITIPAVYLMFDYLLATIQRYNVEIGIIEITVSLALILILGLTTILSQTLKAANANPADNLRSE